ncbi:unnamed protein product [Rotaria socialis]|uniref:PKD/REJ-like domain-containing protein n=1 Tax=Rotaria socialis TaxID=392032 RepID=A0A821FJN5_9BILA|nr:unnamed protein product [Rotaria socialis]
MNTSTAGNYSFQSKGTTDIYGYLYNKTFTPNNTSLNFITQDDDSGDGTNFKFNANMFAFQSAVLVVTTYSVSRTAAFKVIIDGPARVSCGPYVSMPLAITCRTSTPNKTAACSAPIITLMPGSSSLEKPLQFRRSQDFYINANINRSCVTSLGAVSNWAISICNTECRSPISIHHSIIRTVNELYVPAKTLEYGIYELKLTVTMVEFPLLSTSVASYIKINPSGITAVLVPLGTSMITHGHEQTLTLDPGTYSKDPDSDVFNATQWNYTYYCRIYGSPNSSESWIPIDHNETLRHSSSCFSNQSSDVKPWYYRSNESRSSITILAYSLATNQTYQFMVTMDHIHNTSLQATGYALVIVENNRSQVIAIGCVISTMCSHNLEFQDINPSTQVALFSRPVNKSASLINITWNVYYVLTNSSTNVQNWTLFTHTVGKYRDTWFFGNNTSNFTASKQLFQEHPNITLWRFEVIYTFEQEISLSALNFKIKKPPQPGNWSIAPPNGTTSTKFILSCEDQPDIDEIKDYSFFAWTAGHRERLMLGVTTAQTFEVLLPVGDRNPSSVIVIVQVRDKLNCITETNTTAVSVTSEYTHITSFIDIIKTTSNNNGIAIHMNPLVQLLENSNPDVIAQVVTTVSQVFNQLNTEIIESAVKIGIPAETVSVSSLGSRTINASSESPSDSTLIQYMQQLNNHATAREYLMKKINNSQIITSDNFLLQASSLAQLTQATNQLTRSTCLIASSKCLALALALKDMNNTISFEDTQMAADHIMQCATNVLSAINMPLQQRGKALDIDLADTTAKVDKAAVDLESNWADINLLNNKDKLIYERNIYEQNLIANTIANQVNETMVAITTALKVHLNIHQSITVNTTAVFASWETALKTSLFNKTIQPFDSAKIHLPLTLNSNLSDSEVVSLRFVMQPLALASATHSQVNTSMSTMISFSVLDSNGTQIPIVTDDEHPIEIIIPRDPNFIIPPMILHNVTKMYAPTQQFHFQTFNITQSNENLTVSLHFEMRPRNPSLNYLLILKFDGQPHLNGTIENIDDWSLLCSSNMSEDGIHKYFINNNRTAAHQLVHFGLRELNQIEPCWQNLSTIPVYDAPFNFSSDYELRIYTSACYYLDSNNNWQSDGILVGSKTNHYQTQCFSTHLSTFTGSYANAVNLIIESSVVPANDTIDIVYMNTLHSSNDCANDSNAFILAISK